MKFRPLLAALACVAPALQAQETVEPVIVTASRVAESADETLASVTVITREEIERQQAQSLQDLLRALPGVTINNNGGPGKATFAMLRGTEADHVLVLIDGIKIGSATFGGAALQDIPVAQIERIEIVRGPRSSLYGSEAIGGVIQIFTRRAREGVKPSASATVGSYGTHALSAGIDVGTAETWFSVHGQQEATAGFDACPDCNQPDDDGYRAASFAARAGHRFTPRLKAELNVMRNDSETEFDPSMGLANTTEATLETVGGRIDYEFSDRWQTTLTLGSSKDFTDNLYAGDLDSRFDTKRESASFQNNLSLGDHLLTLGFDYLADRVDSTTEYEVESRIDRGLFGQYRAAFGAHDLQLALRTDDDGQFAYHRTGHLAYGLAIDDGLRLTGAYGTAFKAPSFNELYYPGYGDPNLAPETSRSVELGVEGGAGTGRWSLHAYETTITDLIVYNEATFSPDNINEARIRGLEAILAARTGHWDLRAQLTRLEPENLSDDASDGNLLPRRARATARLDADRAFGIHLLGATVVAEGDRYDDLENTKRLPGYVILDLRGEYRFAPDWRVLARLENALDQDYETAAGYAQAGRSYYLTVRYGQ